MADVLWTDDHGPIVPYYRGNYNLAINASNSTVLRFNIPNVPTDLAWDDLGSSQTGWFYPANTDEWTYSSTGVYQSRSFIGNPLDPNAPGYQINTHNRQRLGGFGKLYGKSLYHMIKGDWRWRGDVVSEALEPWAGKSALNDLNAPVPEGTVFDSNIRIVPMRSTYQFNQDGHEFYSDIADHVAYTDTPANRAMWASAGRVMKGSNRWGIPFDIYPTGNYFNYQFATGGYPFVGDVKRRDAYSPATNTTTLSQWFLGDSNLAFLGEDPNSIRIVGDYTMPINYGLYELGPSMVNGWYNFGVEARRDYPRLPGGANSPFWASLPNNVDGGKGFDYIAGGIKGFALFSLNGVQSAEEFNPGFGTNYGYPLVDMTPTSQDANWMQQSPLIGYVQFEDVWHAEDTPKYYPGLQSAGAVVPDYSAWGTMPLAITFDTIEGLIKLVVSE